MNRVLPLTLLLGSLVGCGSPIVGAECRQGFVECDGRCVELSSDLEHCGACGMACDVTETCFAGACVGMDFDAGMGDGAVDDGGTDARLDGSLDAPQFEDATTDGDPSDSDVSDSDVSDGDVADSDPSDSDIGDGDIGDGDVTDGDVGDAVVGDADVGDGGVGDGGDAGDADTDAGTMCPCDLGEQCCDDVCVRPDSDPDNCGGCGVVCAADEVCASGSCSRACDPPLELCGGLCVDTMGSDPDNCGGCGVSCDTGICIDGTCSAGFPGHVVLVGHSYRTSRVSMRRVAGNSVFIPLVGELDVLVYEEFATRPMQSGVDQAINEAALLRGRTWNRIVAEADSVPTLLDDVDVFVVYSQANADNDMLQTLGTHWSMALSSFLLRGGVVVVFDGGGAHSGTWQVLESAGLVDVMSRTDISSTTVDVVAPADQVAAAVPTRYRAEIESVCFDAADDGVVIRSEDGDPVVIHRVF